ncbi:MAG: DUF4344 domain-containing metallopeptidase [Paracoccaceae bacterium]
MTRLAARFATALLAIGLATAAPASPTAAPGLSDGERASLGAMRAIFYHELGHGLIDVFDIPVVGAEETAVDEFSTLMLILLGRQDPAHFDDLIATARFWSLAATPEADGTRYFSAHDFNAKRFFAVVCLMYGSDPDRFYPVMAGLEIPQKDVRRCEAEYPEKSAAWVRLLSAHVPGQAPAEHRGRIAPAYLPPADAEAAEVAALWRKTGLLESFTDEVATLFALPADIPVVARSCGFAQAYWSGGEVTLCYELHAHIGRILARVPSAPEDAPTAAPEPAPAAQASVPATPAPAAPPASAAGQERPSGVTSDTGQTNIADILGGN